MYPTFSRQAELRCPLKSIPFTTFMLSDGTQRRALPCNKNEEMKILNISFTLVPQRHDRLKVKAIKASQQYRKIEFNVILLRYSVPYFS